MVVGIRWVESVPYRSQRPYRCPPDDAWLWFDSTIFSLDENLHPNIITRHVLPLPIFMNAVLSCRPEFNVSEYGAALHTGPVIRPSPAFEPTINASCFIRGFTEEFDCIPYELLPFSRQAVVALVVLISDLDSVPLVDQGVYTTITVCVGLGFGRHLPWDESQSIQ